ncbi:MAG: HEAT repeat domain-containing protein [Candidatus Thorarchaeota archaeon]
MAKRKKKGKQKEDELSPTDPNHPDNLEENARAYFKNAESFREKHQQRSSRQAYEKALEFGRASGTPDGCAIAAEASLYLGHTYKTRAMWEMALERYKETVELAQKSGTPEGFYAGARAAWNLGNTYEEAGMDGLEAAFRDAVELGRDSKMPDGLEVAAKAAFNLAGNLGPGSLDEAKSMWREAIDNGKACGTRDGKEVATKAMYYLAVLLLGAGTIEDAILVFSEMDQYKGGPIIFDHWTDLRWELLAISKKKDQKAILKVLQKISKKAEVAIKTVLAKDSKGFSDGPSQQVAQLLHYVGLYDTTLTQRVAQGHQKQIFKVLSETKEPRHIAQLLSAYIYADRELVKTIVEDFQTHWVEILTSEPAEFPDLLSKLVNDKIGLGPFITLADSAGLAVFLRQVLLSDLEISTIIANELKDHWKEIIKADLYRCTAVLSVIGYAVSADLIYDIETEIGKSGGALSVMGELNEQFMDMLKFYRTASESEFKGAQTDLVNSRFSPETLEVFWSQLLSLSWDFIPITRQRALIAMLNCEMFFSTKRKKKALSRIIELISDPDPSVREQAIGTLKHYRHLITKKQYTPVLMKVLELAEDPHVLVRRAAVWNLSDFSKIISTENIESVLESISNLARDIDPIVRSRVPGCIGDNIKGTGLKDIISDEHLVTAITILLELAEDLEDTVRGNAKSNLSVLKKMISSERYESIVEEFKAS